MNENGHNRGGLFDAVCSYFVNQVSFCNEIDKTGFYGTSDSQSSSVRGRKIIYQVCVGSKYSYLVPLLLLKVV